MDTIVEQAVKLSATIVQTAAATAWHAMTRALVDLAVVTPRGVGAALTTTTTTNADSATHDAHVFLAVVLVVVVGALVLACMHYVMLTAKIVLIVATALSVFLGVRFMLRHGPAPSLSVVVSPTPDLPALGAGRGRDQPDDEGADAALYQCGGELRATLQADARTVVFECLAPPPPRPSLSPHGSGLTALRVASLHRPALPALPAPPMPPLSIARERDDSADDDDDDGHDEKTETQRV